ncbi:MAG: non-canonical purine NTP pyrophosphatase, RdgB/HAM1 family [Flavobacteriaceae bacterium]|nr:non-canonical purine NTP pyrophosphatase, RdgB/HAM1 family [Flavobacteriaceae bacterium]|tara:strand:- start:3142 stop:3726 length:585 start_codon:yes stop_codon:yes gene_type:complete
MELIIASQNQNKLVEFKKILGDKINLFSLSDIGLNQEIPENEKTIKKNAMFKAKFVNTQTGKNVFADDTGLEIDSLNGEPGVYSARYSGLDRNSDKNIELVLRKLKNKANRNSRFKTIISLIIDGKSVNFEGVVEGKITEEKRGSNGFGYDPIFQPNGYSSTFGEMSLKEKNKISHRSIAINKMVQYLKEINLL